ncbi:MAG: acyl-CoA dehydrogenase family protein [Acidimicrobiales bacterium]
MGDATKPWERDPILAASRDLAPEVRAAAPIIERDRCLPPALVESLTEARIFQMFLPRAVGGPEVHPLTAFAVSEEMARADGSTGWCIQVSAATTMFLPYLDPVALDEMAATTSGPIHVAGSARPLGEAVRTDDGYRVKGHWNFASGVRHANWFLATSFVEVDDGSRTARSMLIPVDEGRIESNWDVVGMRGTGSDDFVIDDVFVPRGRIGARHWVERRPEPLYDPRAMNVLMWTPTAGVAIGLARAAVDALVALGERSSTSSPTPLRERTEVQDAVADAEAITAAARAFCIESIDAVWRSLCGEGGDLPERVARAQLAITHAMHEAVRVADRCFHAAGTNAISGANGLERVWRDTHTAVEHAAGRPIHRRAAGRARLGLDPGGTTATS